MLVSKDEFTRLLSAERRKFIMDCVLGGLGDYDNPNYYSSAARVDHGPNTQASIRNSHIVARATRSNLSALGVQITNRRGRILFIVEGKIRISFKKFTRSLRSRNYPTPQALDFLGQKLDLQPITNVIAGYRASDATATSFEVWATCPIDDDNHWEWKLSGAQISMFATAPPEDVKQHTIKRRRVQIRQTAENTGDSTTG
jgi:hypothetical protein